MIRKFTKLSKKDQNDEEVRLAVSGSTNVTLLLRLMADASDSGYVKLQDLSTIMEDCWLLSLPTISQESLTPVSSDTPDHVH